MKKLLVSIIILAAIATSCKKDKTPEPVVYAEENPIPGFLSSTGFDQRSSVNTYVNSIEEGFSFKATVNGKINTLIIKLPVATSNIRITIWDNVSKAILRTENMTIPASNSETTYNIPAFNLVKDKEYFISMNTKSDYIKSRTDNAATTYPVTTGNIMILGVSFKITDTQVFPTDTRSNRYYGDISFKFQQTP